MSDGEPPVVAIPGVKPYYLRLSGPGLYATPEGDFVGVAYEVVRKREGEPRKNRSSWRKPKILQACLDSKGRCDLHVRFYEARQQWHTLYHRVVAFTLLQCFWSVSGKLLRRPYAVPASRWGEFHVHHVNGNTWDVSVANLAIFRAWLMASRISATVFTQ